MKYQYAAHVGTNFAMSIAFDVFAASHLAKADIATRIMKNLIALALISLSPAALAGPITASQGELGLPVVEDFQGFAPVHSDDGLEFPMPQSIYHGSMSGAFQNQTFTTPNNNVSVPYEALNVLSTLVDPLTMIGQGPNNNVWLFDSGGGEIEVLGLLEVDMNGGREGTPTGVVSFLFDIDQDSFGLDVGGVDSTAAFLSATFYARDGSVIDTVTVSSMIAGPYSFVSSGPKFAGVTFSNNDEWGISYDNLRYVPEPATSLLLAVGMFGLGIGMRRQRSAAR